VSNTKIKVAVGSVVFILLIGAFFMASLPSLSYCLFNNYGHPASAKIKVDNKARTLEVNYGSRINNLVKIMEKDHLHLPFYFGSVKLIVFGCLLFLLCLLILRKVFDFEDNDDQTIPFFIILVSFLAVWAGGGIWVMRSYILGTNIAAIHATFKDAELAQGLITNYEAELLGVGIMINGILVALIAFLLFCLHFPLHNFLNWVRKIVIGFVNSYWQSYKEKLFIKIFQLRKDSLFASYMNDNEETILANLVGRKKNDLLEQAGKLNANSEIIQILPNETVELVRYRFEIEHRPWPILVPQKEVLARISMDNFFRHLVSSTKEQAYAELLTKVQAGYSKKFSQAAQAAVDNFIGDLSLKAIASFVKDAQSAQNKEIVAAKEHAKKTFQKSSTGVLRKFKDEVAKIGQDDFIKLLSEIKTGIRDQILTLAGNLSDRSADFDSRQLVLLPQNAKMYFEINGFQVAVIEQPPMVRKVFFSRFYSSNENQEISPRLAFPFVVFVVVVKNKEYGGLSVYYRDKPLRTLDDKLFLPNLPNLHGDCSVCLKFSGSKETSLAGYADEVVAQYWSRQFNTDLSDNFERYRDEDDRLKNIEAWENASQKNPLFPLKVRWLERNSLNWEIQRIIKDHSMRTARESLSQKVESQIEAAFASGGQEFFEQLKKRFSAIPVKDRYAEVFSEMLAADEKEIISGYYSVLQDSFAGKFSQPLAQELFQLFETSADKSLKEIFTALGKEVLFRRRVDGPALINNIKQENGGR
jgi:hypothetical protein